MCNDRSIAGSARTTIVVSTAAIKTPTTTTTRMRARSAVAQSGFRTGLGARRPGHAVTPFPLPTGPTVGDPWRPGDEVVGGDSPNVPRSPHLTYPARFASARW